MSAHVDIDFSKIYESKYGPYRIIAEIDNVGKHKYVRVRFLNTGFETDVRKDTAMSGKAKDDLAGIDFVKTYYSKEYGPYNIIEYMGRNDESVKIVKIRFQNTHNETVVRLRLAETGQVRDPTFGIIIGNIYQSCNYGPYEVLKIESRTKEYSEPRATIRFINTGYEKETPVSSIRTGKIRDDSADKMSHPNICSDDIIRSTLETIWNGMMGRCYNPSTKTYPYYGAIGVTVAEEWHNKDKFIADAVNLPQYDKFVADTNNYRLDKDYLQQDIPKECRIYSPSTCMFLSMQDNANLSTIEKKRNNPLYYTSRYYNVSVRNGNYVVSMSYKGKSLYLGAYTNEIVAAAVANYWQLRYHTFDILPLLNDVPPMDPTEFIKYRVNVKQMYTLIER